MDKKGQAAMEFLMTYGWAILVVLIAIGALMYFIKPSEMLPEKCTIPTGSGLFCEKWSAQVGQIDLKLNNALAEQIIVTAATLTDSEGNTCSLDALVPVTIAQGESGTVTLDQGCVALAAAGRKVQGDLSITFTDEDAFPKTTGGQIIVKIP